MMKGSDIRIQEEKAKLFNEWERFTSTDRELIESYYHRFSKIINDFKRNKHFLEKIASNLKFLNNLQPEWSQNVTIVHQTMDLHEVDYTQLYNFLKYNQVEVNQLWAERLTRAHDPLTPMANSNNPYNYPVFHQDQPSQITQIAQPGIANPNANQNGNGNVVAARAEDNGNGNNGNQIQCYNCRGLEEVGTQLQAEEFDFMAAVGDLEEIEEIFNMFTQEEQYTKLLEPNSEPHQFQQNDSNVIFTVSSVEQSGEIVEQNPTRSLSAYNLAFITSKSLIDLHLQLVSSATLFPFPLLLPTLP
ncbi:hypothetical protein Tco_0826426 [Tanacetum coccineum]